MFLLLCTVIPLTTDGIVGVWRLILVTFWLEERERGRSIDPKDPQILIVANVMRQTKELSVPAEYSPLQDDVIHAKVLPYNERSPRGSSFHQDNIIAKT
jgi:hypothetical protein